jgi:putative transposase
MLKGFKTELRIAEKHIAKIHQSIGICRFLYNSYLAKNKELYELYKEGKIDKKQAFISAIDFDKYINNEVKVLEELKWINECGSKARKKSIVNAEMAFKRFFKGESKFPRFKKKKNQDVKIYFPKNNETDWTVERHRIKIPTLGFVELKEKGYIPANVKVVSGTISMKAGRYYVSVLCDIVDHNNYSDIRNEGIGIDLGIKDLAIVSNINEPFKNINKTNDVRKLKKKLKRLQRQVSRKYEMNKDGKKFIKTKNIIKLEAQIKTIHQKLSNIRLNYVHQITNALVKAKPEYITIEDLNVRGMMKNRHLSKAIQEQNFNEFKRQLTYKCNWNNIELRIVDRYYPSSKMCSECGAVDKELKLSDRTYICKECGSILDRDKNASINLKNAEEYKIA